MADVMQARAKAWENEWQNKINIRKEEMKLVGEIAIKSTATLAVKGVITRHAFDNHWSSLPVPGIKEFGDEVFGNSKSMPVIEFELRANQLVAKKIEDFDKTIQPIRDVYIGIQKEKAKLTDEAINWAIDKAFPVDTGQGNNSSPAKQNSPPISRPSFKEIMGGKGR